MNILKQCFIFGLLTYAVVACSKTAEENKTRTVKKGCEYKPVNLDKYGYKPFEEATIIRSKNGKLSTTLEVALTERNIAGCDTTLRNYNGELVGPTLRLNPGDTLLINLKNKLKKNDIPPPDDINIPHNFNVTNFHSHGLHVSPSGNSDNVLIAINPGVNFDIEISIPDNHPTGTFWYHAHVHGSTALQVSSGMGGALIIEDSESDKSLDSVPEIKATKQKTLMLQQISYDEQGEIENYDCFGPGTKTSEGCNWSKSNRHTTINGQFVPTMTIEEGEVQRWRFIHGGVRETIDLAISGNNDKAWPLYEIAVDGLSLGYINRWESIEMQPGYRSDILVKAPQLESGFKQQTYWLYDKPTSAENALRATDEVRQVLAKIIVVAGSKNMPLPCEKFNQRGQCPRLAITRPHEDVKDKELTGKAQFVTFDIRKMTCPEDPTKSCTPCDTEDKTCKTRFMINNRPFNPVNIRKLELGTASEWTLNSVLANHPYHIHVNPFQYTRKNPEDKDEIIWRDTLLVRQNNPVKIRSRYQRYTGQFVIHCHILDHEDQGMMQIVEVELPGGDAHH
ncbi:multicopper oxidase family protein [Aliikangiella coralliicola]|uniref:Copper oxidase n=1 Tax=Aliikangiella coralliicola TaxID=2592383 RepID=A0A545UEB3_9GAMM|nr:multicopper oxidase family protein [Aliikangiella coralliicola]TQV87816.1 copper oxidase [Aliikangiella coralliicola]